MKILKVTVTTEWVDETTGEITKDVRELSDESVKKPTSKKSSKVKENADPILTLEGNKYTLTSGAVQLLGASVGDKIDIKYKKVNKEQIPMIGICTAFGTQGGNKLTKTNTVSFRGANNAELSNFGSVFKLKDTETPGIFALVGDAPVKELVTPEEEDSVDDILSSLDDTSEIKADEFTL